MRRYLVFHLRPPELKEGYVFTKSFEELRGAQDSAKKMKSYVIFDSKEKRIVQAV